MSSIDPGDGAVLPIEIELPVEVTNGLLADQTILWSSTGVIITDSSTFTESGVITTTMLYSGSGSSGTGSIDAVLSGATGGATGSIFGGPVTYTFIDAELAYSGVTDLTAIAPITGTPDPTGALSGSQIVTLGVQVTEGTSTGGVSGYEVNYFIEEGNLLAWDASNNPISDLSITTDASGYALIKLGSKEPGIYTIDAGTGGQGSHTGSLDVFMLPQFPGDRKNPALDIYTEGGVIPLDHWQGNTFTVTLSASILDNGVKETDKVVIMAGQDQSNLSVVGNQAITVGELISPGYEIPKTETSDDPTKPYYYYYMISNGASQVQGGGQKLYATGSVSNHPPAIPNLPETLDPPQTPGVKIITNSVIAKDLLVYIPVYVGQAATDKIDLYFFLNGWDVGGGEKTGAPHPKRDQTTTNQELVIRVGTGPFIGYARNPDSGRAGTCEIQYVVTSSSGRQQQSKVSTLQLVTAGA